MPRKSIKTCTAKTRRGRPDQGRDKREKAFLESSPRTSPKKDEKKGKEKSWYIADIFTDESEDEKDDYTASGFKVGGSLVRAGGMAPEREDGRRCTP